MMMRSTLRNMRAHLKTPRRTLASTPMDDFSETIQSNLVPMVLEKTAGGERAARYLLQNVEGKNRVSAWTSDGTLGTSDYVSAFVSGSGESQGSNQYVYQLPGRSRYRGYGDIRYDAIHILSGQYFMYGTSSFDGKSASCRWCTWIEILSSACSCHDSSTSRWCSGSASDIQIRAEEIVKTTRMLSQVYADHSGQSLRKWKKD